MRSPIPLPALRGRHPSFPDVAGKASPDTQPASAFSDGTELPGAMPDHAIEAHLADAKSSSAGLVDTSRPRCRTIGTGETA